jgi:putative FmdB family regulatory protein
MPLIEYVCDDCKHQEEIFYKQKFDNIVHPTNCPKCNSEKFHRIMSACLFDVVDGSDYNGGKKDYKSRMSVDDQVKVLNGQKDPW